MIISSREKLLIFTDWFYPGYKAGGPIQSITNLIIKLENYYDISVITSASDLHSVTTYSNIEKNKWSIVTLPNSNFGLNIWYAERTLLAKDLKKIIHELKPSIVYLNGIFSYKFFILPLIALNKFNFFSRIVICPRGMLQKGALEGKSFKKKVYINALKLSRLLKKIYWHATNEEEENDIKKTFGKSEKVFIASNIPKKPLEIIQYPSKQKNALQLVYISLITEKKNLLFSIDLIKKNTNTTLDIYGPVKDVSYWKECLKSFSFESEKIKYKGEVIPDKVQGTFTNYDAFILLTKGENFGHALYESLSAGRPVITSHFTPWNNLQEKKAGWNIDITNGNEVLSLLNSLSKLTSAEFNEYCSGAHKMAIEYYSGLNSINEYTNLFSGGNKDINS